MNDLLKTLFLCGHTPSGPYSLETVKKLSSLLGSPEKAFPSIHVTGSNGKGSVALKIAHALHLSGYRVGLFTSPHLFSVHERIQVQGKPIAEEELQAILEKIFTFCTKENLQPSFFEVLTCAAFDFFRSMSLDVAVIEVGIGGRLDATNIVSSILSVVTSISKEHTALLGESEDKIAWEKAGIFRHNTPVIIGPKAAYPSLMAKAKELSCPLSFVPEVLGFYDKENQSIAQAALASIQSRFPRVAAYIPQGISVRPPCRLEQSGRFLFDVAHNPDAFFRLREAIEDLYPGQKMQVILGMSQDKDVKSCLLQLLPIVSRFYLVTGDTPRAIPTKALSQYLSSLSFFSHECEESISSAVDKAVKNQGMILVCGSFYLMKEAKEKVYLTK